MDLAQSYHTFVKEVYPNAIRIVHRFHMNRYVTDALQTTRKYIQNSLSPFAKADLKQPFGILGKRSIDSITYLDCKQFITKLTKKLKSSRKILFYFSRILKEVVQMELISKNSMTGIELPSEKKNQFEHENEVF